MYQIFTKIGTDYLQTTITLTCQNRTELQLFKLGQNRTTACHRKNCLYVYTVTVLRFPAPRIAHQDKLVSWKRQHQRFKSSQSRQACHVFDSLFKGTVSHCKGSQLHRSRQLLVVKLDIVIAILTQTINMISDFRNRLSGAANQNRLFSAPSSDRGVKSIHIHYSSRSIDTRV